MKEIEFYWEAVSNFTNIIEITIEGYFFFPFCPPFYKKAICSRMDGNYLFCDNVFSLVAAMGN